MGTVTVNKMGRTCGMLGEQRNAYRILVREPEGKRPFWGLRRRREDDINMDLREKGCVLIAFMWLRIRTRGGLL
jgi:hypothetical protein